MNVRKTIAGGNVHPFHASDAWRRGRYGLYQFSSQMPILAFGTAGAPVSVPALPTAGAAQVDVFQLGQGFPVELYQTTAQTLLPLIHASKGLEVALDQVNNESVEYCFGGNRVTNPVKHKVGTDLGVFFRIRLELTTANGIDQLFVGWRDVETYLVPTSILNGGNAGYASMFGIGIASAAASPADVSTVAVTATAAAVTDTGFNWASTLVHDFEVQIRGGKAYAYINGIPLGGQQVVNKDALGNAITSQTLVGRPDFSLVAATTYVPILFIRQDAGLSTVFTGEVEFGPLFEMKKDPAARWE